MDLLQLNYEVKIYLRKNHRAPKELYDIFPLGKSPIVEVIHDDGSKLTLAESGHIIQYIVSNYDTDKILAPVNAADQEKVNYYLHYTEGTLQGLQVSLLVNSVAVEKTPWGVKWLVSSITGRINDEYYAKEFDVNLRFLDGQLAKKNPEYFVGDKLSAADVILSFPIYDLMYEEGKGLIDITGRNQDLNKTYPHLLKWCESMVKQPKLKELFVTMDNKVKQIKGPARL